MLLCLLNTVMNYISRICNEGERHPFNPCSPYQQSSFRTRIIKIFTVVIALRKLSVHSAFYVNFQMF